MNFTFLFKSFVAVIIASITLSSTAYGQTCEVERVETITQVRNNCQLSKYQDSAKDEWLKSVLASYFAGSMQSISEFARYFSWVDSDNIGKSFCVVAHFSRKNLEDPNSFIYNNSGVPYQPDLAYSSNLISLFPNWKNINLFRESIGSCFQQSDYEHLKELF